MDMSSNILFLVSTILLCVEVDSWLLIKARRIGD